MIKNKKQFVKIYWQDAVVYKDYRKNLSLVKKIAVGELIKKTKDFVIIKNPMISSYHRKEKMFIPFSESEGPTFFFIPLGMITKIRREIEK